MGILHHRKVVPKPPRGDRLSGFNSRLRTRRVEGRVAQTFLRGCTELSTRAGRGEVRCMERRRLPTTGQSVEAQRHRALSVLIPAMERTAMVFDDR